MSIGHVANGQNMSGKDMNSPQKDNLAHRRRRLDFPQQLGVDFRRQREYSPRESRGTRTRAHETHSEIPDAAYRIRDKRTFPTVRSKKGDR
jgi:hypothetical protein